MKFGNTTIGGMSFGSVKIGGAKYGNTLVYQAGSPTPPAPVTTAYIRGGADGSYIDTGITPDETTRVIVWARNFNPATNYTWLFGSREAGMTEQFGVYGCITANTGKIGGLYASEFFYTGDAFSLMSGYHKYELNGNVFSVDDTVVATATAATITSSKTIYLFGMNSDSTLMSPVSPIDIFACQIYKNGVLVRNFTAVDSPSVGLYDSVSDTVFTNDGNGAFTYGTFNANSYTPLEYISCSKAQYFDSGVYASNTNSIVSKFMITATGRNWKNVFGSRGASDTNMIELRIGNTTVANRYFYIRYASNSAKLIDSGGSQNSVDLVYTFSGGKGSLFKNFSALGSAQSFTETTFQSTYTIYVGVSNIAGTVSLTDGFAGRIYYLMLDKTHVYVPAKVNDVAGMYETYSGVFYPSATETPFVAGPTI